MATTAPGIPFLQEKKLGSSTGFIDVAEKIYGLVICTWDLLYRSHLLKTHQVNVPVISIGNLSTGGTGKTPVVISLARYLEGKGFRVAVLSRGYKAAKKTQFREADSPDFGDEAYLIQKHLSNGKVFIGKDRVLTAKLAIRTFKPDVIILDDGFQHRRLHRDLNIVLVDGELGLGNGKLLPSGFLREPVIAFHRADWVLITKVADLSSTQSIWGLLKRLRLKHPVQVSNCPFEASLTLASSGESFSFKELHQKPVVLLSGIARPTSFETTVKKYADVYIREHFALEDHINYSPAILRPLETMLKAYPEIWLLTTEKDWVKLKEVLPVFYHNRTAVIAVEPICDWYTILDNLALSKKDAV